MGSFTVTSIGVVRSTRTAIEDDAWDSETSRIELDPEFFIEESIAGLDTFSHVEVLYLFDRVTADKIERGARHPRNNPEWPRVGIFARYPAAVSRMKSISRSIGCGSNTGSPTGRSVVPRITTSCHGTANSTRPSGVRGTISADEPGRNSRGRIK